MSVKNFLSSFESVKGGTKVSMEFEGEVGGFFKMAESLVMKMGMKQIEKDINILKEMLEGDG